MLTYMARTFNTALSQCHIDILAPQVEREEREGGSDEGDGGNAGWIGGVEERTRERNREKSYSGG